MMGGWEGGRGRERREEGGGGDGELNESKSPIAGHFPALPGPNQTLGRNGSKL